MLATLNSRCVCDRPVRDLMSLTIPPELLWLASGFIMLLAAFLASAAE